MGKMFMSNKRFWATNNQKFLSNAMRHYYSLRGNWLSESYDNSNTGLELSGWANRETFLRIKEALGSQRIRRVFRPDVWYLRGGKGSFFTGFIFEVGLSDFARVIRELELALPEFQMRHPEEKVSKLDEHLIGRLESINPIHRQRGLNWVSTFSTSPREFTWLVEAAADKEVSELALAFFKQFGSFKFQGEILHCIAKYCLILGEVPIGINVDGWSFTDIREPRWTHTEPSVVGTDNSRIGAKYIECFDLSVANGGVLRSENGFIDWDAAQAPFLDFVAGNSDFVIGTTANMLKCFVRDVRMKEELPIGIVLGSRVDSNWFHFLIETLPRLLIVEDILDKSIPIIISQRVPAQGVEALKLLTSREIIFVDTNSLTKIQHAFVPGPVIYHPDSQFMWGKLVAKDVNKDLLLQMRSTILLKIGPQSSNEKKFWVRISSNRSVINMEKIAELLLRRGFEIENPGVMSFEQQVQSILGSSIVVGVGGALMSNFIFANAGTKIIVLVSNFGVSYLMPQLLADVSGARLTVIGGPAAITIRSSSYISKLHSSFRVNVKLIQAALDARS